jgi:hypothetical protein
MAGLSTKWTCCSLSSTTGLTEIKKKSGNEGNSREELEQLRICLERLSEQYYSKDKARENAPHRIKFGVMDRVRRVRCVLWDNFRHNSVLLPRPSLGARHNIYSAPQRLGWPNESGLLWARPPASSSCSTYTHKDRSAMKTAQTNTHIKVKILWQDDWDTAATRQGLGKHETVSGPLRCNGSNNMFPRQRINKQQSRNCWMRSFLRCPFQGYTLRTYGRASRGLAPGRTNWQ